MRDITCTRVSRGSATITRARKFVSAAVEDRNRVAHAEPKHAPQMLAFVFRQDDGLVADVESGREESMHRDS